MTTEIHIDWLGAPHLVGRLHTPERGVSASFEYATEWLTRSDAFALDPTGLPLQRAAHHAAALPGVFQDAGPDRWGRLLIERAVRKKMLPRKPWRDLDYVLALDDASRIGALRFRDGGGPFLAATQGRLPPLLRLTTLMQAADAIHHENESTADLRHLLAEGSPLGGARPKSAVLLKDGRLAIAKFPKPDDRRDIAAGEVLALSLAKKAGITVAEHQLVNAAGRSVAVITRFDRDEAGARTPFISAATLLGLSAGTSASYTMMADAIRQFGDEVTRDLHELWRRMVFSLLVSNHDDHERNHAFLMRRPGRWALSPAYDLNPVPEMERVHLHQTTISEDDPEPGVAQALAVAARFALKTLAARQLLREVVRAVRTWRAEGARLRLKAGTLKAYESAFEHELLEEAVKIARL